MSTPLKSDPSSSVQAFERWERQPAGNSGMRRAVASTEMVNRTHRIVRERAVSMQARKSKVRSLWIPLAVSAGLLTVIFFAVLSVLDQYDATPNGLPDASQQMLVLLMWCLPLSAAVLAIVWFRRAHSKLDDGSRG